MKRRRSKRRYNSPPRSGALGGFVSRDVLAAVGGASAAGLVGPMIGRVLPQSLQATPVGRIASAAAVGLVGYVALKRFNRNAALAFAAAAIAPEVTRSIGNRVAGVSGYGSPDGIDYLPTLDGYPMLVDADSINGYDDDDDDGGLMAGYDGETVGVDGYDDDDDDD